MKPNLVKKQSSKPLDKKTYSVSQLAKLAGVSVRTLHHYDHIGLLSPSGRTEAGYRLYLEDELLRLQQILFFKELEVPLNEIKAILDNPEFDQIHALESHRRLLAKRAAQLHNLMHTIDKTLHRLTENDMSVTDEDLYAGFTREQAERYEREALQMYDPQTVRRTYQRVRQMSQTQWQQIKEEGDEVTRGLAELIEQAPEAAEVQALISRHHAWVENFYPCSADMYAGLGQLYSEHDEFRAFYNKYRPGLADFLQIAMNYYADTVLSEQE